MQVIRAEAMGLCFGVRDALTILDEIADPRLVTIRGELVHNPVVLSGLERRGFARLGEGDLDRPDAIETPEVLITAHGAGDATRARLEAAGKVVRDATCPLVARAHRAATGLARQGYFVVVVGRRGHVEVNGLVEDLGPHSVVAEPEEVRLYPSRRIGIVCQTTTPPRIVSAIREAVIRHNPDADEIRLIDTVCRPTKLRQRAVVDLAGRVDAVVVVGGKNSNNTGELAAICEQEGRRAFRVEGPADLDPSWFEGLERIGLTAGTSTLDETIDAVERAIEAIGTKDQEA